MRPVLYQFPISHYCEKIRWALDYKGIQYSRVSLIPGLHMKSIRRIAPSTSVPVLRDKGQVIQGSSAIIDYLDKHYPEHSLTPEDPALRQQAQEWERRLDRLGEDIRLWCYHYLLAEPELAIPLLTSGQPFYRRWQVRLAYPKVEKGMRNWMKINSETAAAAQQRMEAMLAELRTAYLQSHLLVGDHFSRADLTACALFAMVFQPAEMPVPWPARERLPKAMKAWIDQHEDELQPLQVHYAQYR